MFHSAAEIAFDDFAYRDFRVRAGMRPSATGGIGWYGIVHLIQDSRDHAAKYAKRFIDARLDASSATPRQPLVLA